MKSHKFLFLIAIFFSINTELIAQGSVSATYTIDDIPTSHPSYDASCTGPSTVLSITLPVGDNYTVTGIDIAYNMTALGIGYMSDQRSQIHCQNTNTTEAVVNGAGNNAGTITYNRTGVNIANASFTGGTELIFEMRAWRIFQASAGCNTLANKVNASSWTITVHYAAEVVNPKVGIEQASPKATLDVNGEIKP